MSFLTTIILIWGECRHVCLNFLSCQGLANLLLSIQCLVAYQHLLSVLQSRKQLEARVYDTADSLSSSRGSESSDSKPPARDPEEGYRPSGTTVVSKDAYGSPWLLQYTTLFRRALKVRRFEALSLQDFAQCICVAVLSGKHVFWCSSFDNLGALKVLVASYFFNLMFISSCQRSFLAFPHSSRSIWSLEKKTSEKKWCCITRRLSLAEVHQHLARQSLHI